MTKIELIDAYVRGDMDRRSFMRKLAAVGVSATAATAYAGSLAQGASAAPNAGFVMRAQTDADYGIDDLDEFIQQLIQSIIAVIQSILDRIFGNFGVSDFQNAGFSAQDFTLLQALRGQAAEQAEALDAQVGSATSAQAQTALSGTLAEQLSTLATEYNRYASALARMAPRAEQAEQRQLLTAVGFAASRQAAVTNHIAGLTPVPSALQQSIDLSTI